MVRRTVMRVSAMRLTDCDALPFLQAVHDNAFLRITWTESNIDRRTAIETRAWLRSVEIDRGTRNEQRVLLRGPANDDTRGQARTHARGIDSIELDHDAERPPQRLTVVFL